MKTNMEMEKNKNEMDSSLPEYLLSLVHVVLLWIYVRKNICYK
jgi:hypothetical protein